MLSCRLQAVSACYLPAPGSGEAGGSGAGDWDRVALVISIRHLKKLEQLFNFQPGPRIFNVQSVLWAADYRGPRFSPQERFCFYLWPQREQNGTKVGVPYSSTDLAPDRVEYRKPCLSQHHRPGHRGEPVKGVVMNGEVGGRKCSS